MFRASLRVFILSTHVGLPILSRAALFVRINRLYALLRTALHALREAAMHRKCARNEDTPPHL